MCTVLMVLEVVLVVLEVVLQLLLLQLLKLQMARFRTLEELQTRDLEENDRLDVLYLPMGGLGGPKRPKTAPNPKTLFSNLVLEFHFSAPFLSL